MEIWLLERCAIVFVMEPFPGVSGFLLFFRRLFALRGYITTSWLGVPSTSPDSLHIRSHVDEAVVKILSVCTGFLFCFVFTRSRQKMLVNVDVVWTKRKER